MDASSIGLSLAFLGGLASFLSPCVFALVPAYIGYLSGRSAGSQAQSRWYTLLHGLFFVMGFSTVFILLGLGASAIGGALFDMRPWLTKVGGVVVIIFGLHMTGLIRIPFLQYDVRHQEAPDRNLGYLSSFLLGIFFSAGWSPCVGPILGTILTLSFNSGNISQGFWLLAAYSAGLAIPFLIAALEIGLVTTALRRYGKVVRYVEIGMGVLMIGVGVLLFFGRFEQLATLGSFFRSIDEAAVGRILLIGLCASILAGLIPAFLARRKGRNFTDWWIFGALLFPIALAAALLIKPVEKGPGPSEYSGGEEPGLTPEG